MLDVEAERFARGRAGRIGNANRVVPAKLDALVFLNGGTGWRKVQLADPLLGC